jgi:hypothetical protein
MPLPFLTGVLQLRVSYLIRGLVQGQRRSLVLLVLVKVERRLDFVPQALAFGRLRVSVAAVLLFVDIASPSTLFLRQSCTVYVCHGITYAGVELFLWEARVDLGDQVDRATTAFVRLRCNARRFSDVASSSSAGREVTVDGFALDAFADEASVGIDTGVGANVASACIRSQPLLLRECRVRRTDLRDRSSGWAWWSSYFVAAL